MLVAAGGAIHECTRCCTALICCLQLYCLIQVRVVKNAIRMRSGITVALKSPYAGSAALEMKALEKLAQAVDRCASVSLAGFALFVGDSYGVDALGNIWLNGDDDVEAWTEFLHKV